MKKLLLFLTIALPVGLFFATSVVHASAPVLPPEIGWEMAGTNVRFSLHFYNPDPLEPTLGVAGEMRSQMFGVFVQDYGTIGTFEIPPIEAESFFDVFFEVPLSELPQGGGGGGGLVSGRALQAECPPPMWVGNVHVLWSGSGGTGEVTYHAGDIGVCPGGAASCVHVLTGCAGNLMWMINNACQGWTVTLVNEDHSAAPASLPLNWTGWICVTADASVPIGAQCCFSVDFWCNGLKSTINVCAFACSCETSTQQNTWGGIKNIYR